MTPKGKIIINGKSFDESNFQDIASTIDTTQLWVKEVYDFLCAWFDTKDTISVETSGSTGNPKTIALHKAHMRASAMRTNQFLQLNTQSKALLCLPVRYIAGKMMLVRALVGGYSIIVQEPNIRPLEKLDMSIDFVALTPMQLQASVDDIARNAQTKLIIGGAAVNNSLQVQIQALQNEIYETYGMSETCTHIALRKICPAPPAENFEALEGVSVATDNRNCLTISCEHLGISNLVTNDIVEIHAKNTFCWIGRYDNIINSGGVKVSPEKLEAILAKSLNNAFFVGALPDDKLMQKVVLFVEIGNADKKVLTDQIEKACENLHPYEHPKQIVFCEKFVYNNGKIMRGETVLNWEIGKI